MRAPGRCTRFLRNQAGAVVIHAAVGLMAMTGASALAVDYGLLLAERGVAQTAADAGALAGAVALAFDSYSDRGPSGIAARSVETVARVNAGVGGTTTSVNVTFPVCPDGFSACVRAEVTRGGVPTFFGQWFGTMSATVTATATAEAKGANTIDCMKPFAVPDKWIERNPKETAWADGITYDKYVQRGRYRGTLLPKIDAYEPPSAASTGTGFTLLADLGTKVTLKVGDPLHTISPGWFFAVEIPRTSSGGNDYRENIATCNGIPIGVGDRVRVKNGNMTGPTVQGITDLIALDPAAYWNATKRTVAGSCATARPPCARFSPRIVAIPVFDPEDWEDSEWEDDVPGGRATVKIVNILGFFVERLDASNNIVGYLVMAPGLLRDGSTLVDAASFLRTSVLVN